MRGMMMKRTLLLLLLLSCCLAAPVAAQAPGPQRVTADTANAAAGGTLTNGEYTLHGTLGQTSVATSRNTHGVVNGGIWYGINAAEVLVLEKTYRDVTPARTEVGEMLGSGSVSLTWLRAAMILGSGSASFEIMRYLVDRLPLMITPIWVHTRCQPIAISNVLDYLVGCLENEATAGQTYDIGGPDILSYKEMFDIYARAAGFKPRLIIPVPVLTPTLSSYWIHLVTPVPAAIARPLAEGLSNPVVCTENSITELLPQELFDARKAIRLALDRIRQQQVETTWSDSGNLHPAEWSSAGDPSWSGGSAFEDSRELVIDATAEEIWPAVTSIGGDVGYYYANWLWQLRGLIDRLGGGVGLQRGRRSAAVLYPGDVVDFWRVLAIKQQEQLLLIAEMKLPGKATLSFKLIEQDNGTTTLQQTARFLPRGLLGLLYWYLVTPFHFFVFNGMIRGIGAAAKKPVRSGPRKIKVANDAESP